MILIRYKRLLPVVLAIGVGVLYFVTLQPTQTARILPAKTVVAPLPMNGQPVRLIIPALTIDANVVHVGLIPDGDMDAPAQLGDAGWYKYGSHPGDQGSAVIAGHVGVPKAPGIFSDLHKLKKGDQVSTVDDKGRTLTFIVRETRTYGHTSQPDEIFRGKGGAYLNLITCTGAWLPGQQTFSERLVVFTDLLQSAE